MRAIEIIRNVLDLIDGLDAVNSPPPPVVVSIDAASSMPEPPLPDELARLKQIAGLVSDEVPAVANQPCEQVAGIEAVTTDAGGGVNGPKHPSDIRSDSVSMYPNTQYKGN